MKLKDKQRPNIPCFVFCFSICLQSKSRQGGRRRPGVLGSAAPDYLLSHKHPMPCCIVTQTIQHQANKKHISLQNNIAMQYLYPTGWSTPSNDFAHHSTPSHTISCPTTYNFTPPSCVTSQWFNLYKVQHQLSSIAVPAL